MDSRPRTAPLPVDQRVEDLLGRMTLQEKAGQLFHTMVAIGPGGELAAAAPEVGLADTTELVAGLGISHLNLVGPVASAREAAQWHNRLQDLARSTRLGIPVTVSSDPRNASADNPGAAAAAGALSQWPEPLGLAATRDAGLVWRAADAARQEYLALGIRSALHPQVDLATEYRWSRISGTCGEDPQLTSELVAAYVEGFQGASLGPASVATTTKQFPGGGPQKDGEDPHFPYGREQVYPGGNLEDHLRPFAAAIAAGTAQVMPYYGMPVGTDLEEVAFGFNRGVATGLLRERMGFDGVVCTDWGLITDASIFGQWMPARAWGVEHLSPLERVEKALHAGVDQFGGETRTDLVLELVRSGRVPQSRLDESVRRLLRVKFQLGLFEDPYVDVEAAGRTVGRADLRAAGLAAQSASVTVLTDRAPGGGRLLPLRPGTRVFLDGLDPAAVGDDVVAVPDPARADVAVVRVQAPHEPRPGGFEAHFHTGALEFGAEELERVLSVARTVPTVVDVHLDRPAALPEIAEAAACLTATFGVGDEALWAVLTGRAVARGRLPFDLPRSTAAVAASRSDVPFDTADPVFRFGDGLVG
ncbi:glycoside hydrolase family 3 C-terminal domain-containing protein [Paenibacillus sp. TRM 82003]|nr:glycoside hydrolase family 3 N-terminal domain-containing protein [Kineococcus sp. TRM81007]MCI2240417.1 glycoside hydrolase family 3 C-terminal domain-containing protein [Kineococcus sp. TRM81007]MCI3927407.1 glycoside hydrolase family 3 C-terminal domain-containing protein [Paenibacillus sp. TRM 82003]